MYNGYPKMSILILSKVSQSHAFYIAEINNLHTYTSMWVTSEIYHHLRIKSRYYSSMYELVDIVRWPMELELYLSKNITNSTNLKWFVLTFGKNHQLLAPRILNIIELYYEFYHLSNVWLFSIDLRMATRVLR